MAQFTFDDFFFVATDEHRLNHVRSSELTKTEDDENRTSTWKREIVIVRVVSVKLILLKRMNSKLRTLKSDRSCCSYWRKSWNAANTKEECE
jgi:hypothetical protein